MIFGLENIDFLKHFKPTVPSREYCENNVKIQPKGPSKVLLLFDDEGNDDLDEELEKKLEISNKIFVKSHSELLLGNLEPLLDLDNKLN